MSSDCDRLMGEFDAELHASFMTLVFFRITWQSGDFGPTVVARCIDILRAIVPTYAPLESGKGKRKAVR